MVTFAIVQFKDTVLGDVSPLDCLDLLLGIPYQSQRNSIYMAKACQYKLTKEGHTYILIEAPPKAPTTKQTIPHVQLNQRVNFCLVRPIPINNTTHSIPEPMNPLLQEFADLF